MERLRRLLPRRIREKLARRQRGQVLVLFALGFTFLTAGVGMAADMGLWLVEWQRLRTAVDSASIAGARYLVAYSGDPSAMTVATGVAQTYLTQYGFPSGTLSPLSFTNPATRQFRIQATRTRPTLLIRIIGINTLSAVADSRAIGELKADIYVAADVTASMSSTDMTNSKNAINAFIDMLGLDPANTEGPQVAIGRFIGERCMRKNQGGYDTDRDDPDDSDYWYAYTNWKSTTNGWCDPTQRPDLTASFGTIGTDRPPNPTTPYWSPFYPGAYTVAQLGKSASTAHSAVNVIEGDSAPLVDDSCVSPEWSSPTGSDPLLPYRKCDRAGTSHVAGIATAMMELNSVRARGAPYRKVMIVQTDGVVCTISTPFTPTQAQNRAIALANYAKTTPTVFSGMEVFVIMFWADDGNQSCGNEETNDSLGSLYPNCPNATTLAGAGPRTVTDTYLISVSSSTNNTCDHYFPWNKNNGTNLSAAYREILKRIAVGKLLT
jgi:hypothetical protein